ncbi:MAG: hypothetical protein ACM3NF_09120 [Gemmatimonadota bacterium]
MKTARACLLLALGISAAMPGPGVAEVRTVSWNPSTAYTDGTPFAPGTTVAYDVFWSADPGLGAASLNTIASSVSGTSTTFDPDSAGMPRGGVVYVTADAVLGTGEKSALATAFAWSVPSLSSLSIAGPSSVNENGSATYTATAMWSDGTTTPVTPSWSEDSAYASIGAGGVLTTSLVTANQAVTVSASYASGGVTRTASAQVTIVNVAATLSSLSIAGPSSVNENGSATYTATAAWSDGTTTPVTPSWSENSAYASISAGGVLTTSLVTGNQAVTVSASYASGGVTRTASAQVTIVDVAATLSSLSIAGPSSVNENGSATYAATATWSDGTLGPVTAAWSEDSAYASISAGGVLTTSLVTGNQAVTVSASYASGGVTRTASAQVTIVDVPDLVSLSIAGPSSVNENGSAAYAATATWGDGTMTPVSPVWSEDSAYASIGAGGVLTTSLVTGNQAVTVSASYASGGVTRTASAQVTIVDVPTTTPAAPENVDVSGPVATTPSQLFRLKWDPVLTYADGAPIAAGGVTYTAYWTTDPSLAAGKLQPLASRSAATSVDFDPAAQGMKKNQRVYLTTKALLPSGEESSLAAAVSWKASNIGPVPPANGRIYKK